MREWSKLGARALVGLMALNITAAAGYFILQDRIRKARQPVVMELGSAFPVFSGVDVTGVNWEASDAPCRVIRVTDDDCSYCRKDKPSYSAFLDAAKSASCEIIELSPRAGGMAEDPRLGVVQLEFVNADVGSALAPFVTPHTVILDNSWTMKWNRRGIFDEKSLSAAIEVVTDLGTKVTGRKSAGTH